jgi:predicted permease
MGTIMETLLKDIRYAIRGLLKRPGFTTIAVITLALGIGANTAIFTLVNAVMLKSLPVTRPNELVLFTDVGIGEGTSEGDPLVGPWQLYSYSAYQYLRDHNPSFQDILAFRSGQSRLGVSFAGDAAAQRAQGQLVSGNYFSVLGVSARLGRVLMPADDTPGASPAAVISHRYWQQQFNRDPGVVGRSMLINGTGFTIVGVTPEEFFGERVRRPPDYWLPLSFQPQVELRESTLDKKDVYFLTLIGRLNPGVGIEQAQASTNLALRQFLTAEAGSQITEQRQRDIQNTSARLVPGAQGISPLRFIYSKPLQMLMAIVAMVLLIACANVGSLFLSRAASRRAEMSLRLALGASRQRIIHQLLTESFLLAFIGATGGVLLAIWGVRLLVGMVTSESPLETQPDLLVLSFTAAIALISGLLFGLVPAIRASRADLASAMKEKSRTGTDGSRLGLTSALVITQVCLSMVLLTGAGLFARSLLKLQEEELGFKRDAVLLVGVDPRIAGYKLAELPSLYQRLLQQMKPVPGVNSLTVSSYSPMSGTRRSSDITVQGYAAATGENLEVEALFIGPDFGKTLGVPLLQGREINLQDNEAARKVAVVNQAFVDHYFKGQNPLGRIFSFGDKLDPTSQYEIVGVLGNVKSRDARRTSMETVYRSILQSDDQLAFSATFEVRANGDAGALTPLIREAINQTDNRLPVFGVTTMQEQVEGTFKQDRLIARLMSFFGALALLLACVGLYGVMAQSVARRTNEIGIRMALGAQRGNIQWMVLKETFLLVFVGLAVGIPMALGAATLVSKQLFGLKPTDPVTLIAAAVVLTVVAVLAGYLPARRASRVDPLVALRYE